MQFKNIKRRIKYLGNYFSGHLPKIPILVYHRVLPETKDDPLMLAVSLKTFNTQIDIISKIYSFIPLSEAIRQYKTGFISSKKQVVLTFDDGYSDNYNIVYPILRQKGIPASFFIVTDYTGSNEILWCSELIRILNSNKRIVQVKIGNITVFQRIMQPRLFFISSVIDKMKALNYEQRSEILDYLRRDAYRRATSDYFYDRCMTWEQIKEMSAHDMEIGSHGLSHSSLAKISFSEATNEIKRSKEIIENNIRKECFSFAFPFGKKHDFNPGLVDYVRQVGFKACLLNIDGYNYFHKDMFCLRRVIMEEASDINDFFH